MNLLDELRKHSCIDIDCNDDAGMSTIGPFTICTEINALKRVAMQWLWNTDPSKICTSRLPDLMLRS